jgi:UDP-glucuronate 4-epimerase
MKMKKVLVTGVAGFIGFSLVKKLTAENEYEITGLDNINDYYDRGLKYDRLAQLGFDATGIEKEKAVASGIFSNLKFIQLDLENGEEMNALFALERFDLVVHLAGPGRRSP